MKTLFLASMVAVASFLGFKSADYIVNSNTRFDVLDKNNSESITKDNYTDNCVILNEGKDEDFTYVGCNSFF